MSEQTPSSLMRREIDEIPAALRRLLTSGHDAIEEIADRLRTLDPAVIATVARGSSDHAATYFKYACETTTGRPVASLGPSVVSVYGTKLRLAGQAALAISQSGRSPDIVALLKATGEGGARTIALVNVEGSPLSDVADHTLALAAGPEKSVAATKSFVSSVAASLAILAAWTGDGALRAALDELPDRLDAMPRPDWSAALPAFAGARSLFTLGRGPGFAVACEAALKCKETSVLHAEAYSGAEVLHGPVSLVEAGFPILAFVPDDAARAGLAQICARVEASGATLFTVGEAGYGTRLPHAATGHALTEPLAMLAAFYGFIESVSRARGHDPDVPRGLRKVTETI